MELSNLPSSNLLAKRLDAALYFTGKLCKRGHTAPRYKGGRCIACAKEHSQTDVFKIGKKASYEKHKIKRIQKSIEWARENPERRKEIVRKCDAGRKDKRAIWELENRDTLLAKKRAYHEQKKGELNARYALWKKNNKETVNATNANRRAREKGAEGRFTKNDILELLAKQHGTCANCAVVLVKYHVDHIKALSRGGSNWPCNLQILCPPCNVRKWAH